MKVVTWKCDGCGGKLSEDDESSGRCFELRTPFRTVETCLSHEDQDGNITRRPTDEV